MIEVNNLVKKFGARLVLDQVSFQVEPGRVTAFLGPNGSGKTTTMRIILGLEEPTSGTALVDGKPYQRLQDPMFRVGALLDARTAHPGRSAFNHLLALAHTHGISASRVDEVIGIVGLTEVAGNRVGGYSLGMRQRLGIAGAMLGDPETYIFDEPVNGLDPDGVRWFRDLVRSFADEGRTVFLSSHLISEVEITADHVIMLGRGRVLADSSLIALALLEDRVRTRVRSPRLSDLAAVLRADGLAVHSTGGMLVIDGATPDMVGELAAVHSIPLHELGVERDSLEDVYRSLTEPELEYRHAR